MGGRTHGRIYRHGRGPVVSRLQRFILSTALRSSILSIQMTGYLDQVGDESLLYRKHWKVMDSEAPMLPSQVPTSGC